MGEWERTYAGEHGDPLKEVAQEGPAGYHAFRDDRAGI